MELFEAIVETIPDMIFAKEASDLRYVLLNQAGEDLLGIPRDQLLGRTDHDLFARAQADALVEKDREVLAGGVTIETFDEEILSPAKGLRLLHGKRCLIHEDGKPRYVLGIFRDVTDSRATSRERDLLERQLQEAQKMEAIGLLAGGIAHDFNNMLTVMLAAGQTLLETVSADSPERKDVEDIIASVHRAAGLVRQLLAFSRRQVLQPKVLDLNAVVANIERLLRRLINGEIKLIIVPGREIGLVRADVGQLEQIIVNLAINARDAMPNGGTLTFATSNVTLDDAFVRRHPGATTGPHVLLAISDTGTGMSAAVKAHLFEPFFTTKKPGSGTGLGLSTVYGIVRQSGGYIMADSEEGRGTTFRIYLPRVMDAAAVDAVRDRLPTATLYGNETIMLIEDDAVLREVAVGILRGFRYKVLSAADFDAAVKVASAHSGPIHLLITDVLPDPTGGLPSELTSVNRDLRVLLMSGQIQSMTVDPRIAPRLDLLEKPFTPDSLVRAVRTALDRKD
ncbi:MAG TPA: ATP-binding protein [Gemmatimonadaceae bacterium]|nr:ATP-binding protein [Gemmatimonadaceae bacterium]